MGGEAEQKEQCPWGPWPKNLMPRKDHEDLDNMNLSSDQHKKDHREPRKSILGCCGPLKTYLLSSLILAQDSSNFLIIYCLKFKILYQVLKSRHNLNWFHLKFLSNFSLVLVFNPFLSPHNMYSFIFQLISGIYFIYKYYVGSGKMREDNVCFYRSYVLVREREIHKQERNKWNFYKSTAKK